MARHFLLVEKSDIMRKILHSRILANIDDAVISEVHTDDEVFRHIERNPCHLVLSSWDVTDPEGLNLVNKLSKHEKGKAIPCLMLLGDDAKYEQKVISAGIKEYLVMPCSPKLLSETINRVCNPVSLRESRRYSPTDTVAQLEQRTVRANADVLNISAGGLLCDLTYGEDLNFTNPMMISVAIVVAGKNETVEGLYSVMTNMKVLERNSDFTPRRVRVSFKFVNTPESFRKRLEDLLEEAEHKPVTGI